MCLRSYQGCQGEFRCQSFWLTKKAKWLAEVRLQIVLWSRVRIPAGADLSLIWERVFSCKPASGLAGPGKVSEIPSYSAKSPLVFLQRANITVYNFPRNGREHVQIESSLVLLATLLDLAHQYIPLLFLWQQTTRGGRVGRRKFMGDSPH